jgi:hypothetical protein
VHLGCEMLVHYFSSSGEPGAVSRKTALGQVTSNLCFLHPVGSAGHVVHFGASGAQNVDALFFMFGWARCGFHIKRTATFYTELVFFALCGICGS